MTPRDVSERSLVIVGHGLSYTSFSYSAVAMAGRNITFTVTNSGSVFGAEVAQVYAGLPATGLGADEPPQRLVAFDKAPTPGN